MANKTTTLTTQMGDSIYPNVLDENIPDTIARVSDVNKLKTDVEADYVSKTYGDSTYATIIQLSGTSIQSVDAYGEGGATTIEKGKIATDLTGVELKIPFVLNIYEDNTLSGVPTRIVMTNKFGENNYLGTLDFLNHYLVTVVKGIDGKYSYSSSIVPNATGNTLFNKPILVPENLVDPTPILPCTASDNGKVLSVVNGEAQWSAPSGGSISVTFED